MAAFREGKLTRKKNGQLQSTVVKNVRPKKKLQGKSIRSHHSKTQNCLLEITHPRNIYTQRLFMKCACVIKQTLNYSF